MPAQSENLVGLSYRRIYGSTEIFRKLIGKKTESLEILPLSHQHFQVRFSLSLCFRIFTKNGIIACILVSDHILFT